MNRRWVLFIPVLLVIGLGVVLYLPLAENRDPTKLESARIDDPFPAFSLPSLVTGASLTASVVSQGTPVLVNVWATWCPSCQVEHPYLNALATKGVRIVGLNYKDEDARAREWLDRLGNPYVEVIRDVDGKLGFDLGVYGAPETYLVDGTGVVRYRHVGVVDEQVWGEVLLPRFEALGGRLP